MRSHATVILGLINDVESAIMAFGPDHFPDANTSRGFGEMLEGLVVLLNENIAPFDGGNLYRAIDELATDIGWDLDNSEMAQ